MKTRKILCFTIFILLVAVSSMPVLGANTKYDMGDIGLSVSLPDTMVVFTRETPPDDEIFASLGITYDGMMSMMESTHTYVNAMDIDGDRGKEILISCEESNDTDYRKASPSELFKAAEAEKNKIAADGRKIIKTDIYEHPDIDFVETHSEDASSHQIQYTTVISGKAYHFRMVCYGECFSSNEESQFEDIMKSVKFDALSKKKTDKNQKKTEPVSDSSAVATDAKPDSDSSGEKKETASSADEASDGVSTNGYLLAIVIIILVCTVPALVFRFVFAGGGLGCGAATGFALVYSIAMGIICWLWLGDNPFGLSKVLSIVPLLWGFAIYRIVKRNNKP